MHQQTILKCACCLGSLANVTQRLTAQVRLSLLEAIKQDGVLDIARLAQRISLTVWSHSPIVFDLQCISSIILDVRADCVGFNRFGTLR